jgi:hypothetical protein
VVALDVHVIGRKRTLGPLVNFLAHRDQAVALFVLREAALVLDVRDREVLARLAGRDDGGANMDAVREVAVGGAAVVVLEAVVVRLGSRIVDARDVLRDVAIAKPVAAEIDRLAGEGAVAVHADRARCHADAIRLRPLRLRRLLRIGGRCEHHGGRQDERDQARVAVHVAQTASRGAYLWQIRC